MLDSDDVLLIIGSFSKCNFFAHPFGHCLLKLILYFCVSVAVPEKLTAKQVKAELESMFLAFSRSVVSEFTHLCY